MSAPALLGCPHCNRPISFVAELAGKVVACPHCRKQLQMPATAPVPPPAPGRPPGRPQLTPSTAPTEAGSSARGDFDLQFTAASEPPPTSDRHGDERPQVEPVWYRRTENLATAWMWLGIAATVAIAALVIHFDIIPLFRAAAGQPRVLMTALLATAGLLLFLAAMLVGWLVLRAALFVLVDMARNVRTLRQAQQPNGK